MTHTPGPWRWEINLSSKHIELVGGGGRAFDLTVMEPKRWGMNSATLWFRDPAESGMNLMLAPHEQPQWTPPFPDEEHHTDWRRNITHPDACLIASAPELLVALKRAHEELEDHTTWSYESAIERQRRMALIRKAQGMLP
jgi:hypothetical protein